MMHLMKTIKIRNQLRKFRKLKRVGTVYLPKIDPNTRKPAKKKREVDIERMEALAKPKPQKDYEEGDEDAFVEETEGEAL